MNYIEKRRFVRLDINSRLNFQFMESGSEKPVVKYATGNVKNLSVEGVCFSSDKEIKPGSRIELEIFLPNGKAPIKIKGEVVWSKPIKNDKETVFDTGVKLINVAVGDENRFLVYMCDKMTSA